MCIGRLQQYILENQSKFFPPPVHSSNEVILYLTCFDITSQIHWPACMVAWRFLMSCVTWLTLLDLLPADVTLCLAQDVKGCYIAAPTLSLGFEIKNSDIPTENSACGGNYRKVGSRSFSTEASLSRLPQSVLL